MTIRLSTAARNASTDAVVDLIDAGSGPGVLEIRSGSQPASAQDAATGTLLAAATLADPAFGASATGTASLTDPASVTASATGTAGWFRVKDSTGGTVFDGKAGVSGDSTADLILSTVSIVSGGSFDITTPSTYTTPAG